MTPSHKGALLSAAFCLLVAWGVLSDKMAWDAWLWPYSDGAFWSLVLFWGVAVWRRGR